MFNDNEMANLIAELDSADKSRRIAAIIEVSRLPQAQAEPGVDRLLALADIATDRQEFAMIVQVLGQVGGERARPLLENVLMNNLGTKTGRLAAQGLGAIGNAQSSPILDMAQNSPSHIVRSAAKQALAQMGRRRK